MQATAQHSHSWPHEEIIVQRHYRRCLRLWLRIISGQFAIDGHNTRTVAPIKRLSSNVTSDVAYAFGSGSFLTYKHAPRGVGALAACKAHDGGMQHISHEVAALMADGIVDTTLGGPGGLQCGAGLEPDRAGLLVLLEVLRDAPCLREHGLG